jgi:hypothetical protein
VLWVLFGNKILECFSRNLAAYMALFMLAPLAGICLIHYSLFKKSSKRGEGSHQSGRRRMEEPRNHMADGVDEIRARSINLIEN